MTAAVIRGADYRHWATNRAAGAAIRSVPIKAAETRRLSVGNLVVEVSGGGPTQPVGRVVLVDNAALQSTNESLEDTDNLPAPEVIAAEIVEDLQAALDQFSEIASTLQG